MLPPYENVARVGPSALALAILVGCASFGANAATFPLGEAGSFGALASQNLTCTGSSTVTGDVGISPGTSSSIIGFSAPCSLTGSLRASDLASPATQAIADARTAFNALTPAAMPGGTILTGQDLGVVNLGNGPGVLTPGVSTFSTSGALIGTIIADQSVSLKTGASLNGRTIGWTASVTLDGNAIVVPSAAGAPPNGALTILGELCEGEVLTASSTITDPDGLGLP